MSEKFSNNTDTPEVLAPTQVFIDARINAKLAWQQGDTLLLKNGIKVFIINLADELGLKKHENTILKLIDDANTIESLLTALEDKNTTKFAENLVELFAKAESNLNDLVGSALANTSVSRENQRGDTKAKVVEMYPPETPEIFILTAEQAWYQACYLVKNSVEKYANSFSGQDDTLVWYLLYKYANGQFMNDLAKMVESGVTETAKNAVERAIATLHNKKILTDIFSSNEKAIFDWLHTGKPMYPVYVKDNDNPELLVTKEQKEIGLWERLQSTAKRGLNGLSAKAAALFGIAVMAGPSLAKGAVSTAEMIMSTGTLTDNTRSIGSRDYNQGAYELGSFKGDPVKELAEVNRRLGLLETELDDLSIGLADTQTEITTDSLENIAYTADLAEEAAKLPSAVAGKAKPTNALVKQFEADVAKNATELRIGRRELIPLRVQLAEVRKMIKELEAEKDKLEKEILTPSPAASQSAKVAAKLAVKAGQIDSLAITREHAEVKADAAEVDSLVAKLPQLKARYTTLDDAFASEQAIVDRVAEIDQYIATNELTLKTDAASVAQFQRLDAFKAGLVVSLARTRADIVRLDNIELAKETAVQDSLKQTAAISSTKLAGENKLAEAGARVAKHNKLDDRSNLEMPTDKEIEQMRKTGKSLEAIRDATEAVKLMAQAQADVALDQAIAEALKNNDTDLAQKLKGLDRQSQLSKEIDAIYANKKLNKNARKQMVKDKFKAAALSRPGLGLNSAAGSWNPNGGGIYNGQSGRTLAGTRAGIPTTESDTTVTETHFGLKRDVIQLGHINADPSVTNTENNFYGNAYAKYLGLLNAPIIKTPQQAAHYLAEAFRNVKIGDDWYYVIRESWANQGGMQASGLPTGDAVLKSYFMGILDRAAQSTTPNIELAKIGMHIGTFSSPAQVTLYGIQVDANGNKKWVIERRASKAGEMFLFGLNGEIIGSLLCINPAVITPKTMSETTKTIIINNNTNTVNENDYNTLMQYAVPTTETVYVQNQPSNRGVMWMTGGLNINLQRIVTGGGRGMWIPQNRWREHEARGTFGPGGGGMVPDSPGPNPGGPGGGGSIRQGFGPGGGG